MVWAAFQDQKKTSDMSNPFLFRHRFTSFSLTSEFNWRLYIKSKL